MRSWLLRWRVAGGFTLPLPQIRSGATLRRSAISDFPDANRQRQILKCCKEHAHPPFQEDWGMCLRRQWPTHPSQAIPLWGVGFYPPSPFQGRLCWHRRLGYCAAARIKNSRLSLSTARLGYRAVARTALPLKHWPNALLLKRCCRTMLDNAAGLPRCRANGVATQAEKAPSCVTLGRSKSR